MESWPRWRSDSGVEAPRANRQRALTKRLRPHREDRSEAVETRPHQRAVAALVGRANVGKSTLFNRLCGGRGALVADHPGLTRDRQYGLATIAGRPISLIDTGGLDAASGVDSADRPLAAAVTAQVDAAVDEAATVVLVADARDGLTEADRDIARRLRKQGARTLVVVNKMDGAHPQAAAEFAALGFGEPTAISAVRGHGVDRFAKVLLATLPDVAEDSARDDGRAKIAVVGRPNVGKSTLVNRWLGSDRQIVFDQPGTTRDAIDVPFGDRLLIDTAGVRRKAKTTGMVEKFSVVKTLDALRRADVAVLVVDCRDGLVEQDLHILQYATDAGAGVVLAVNKCDDVNAEQRARGETSVGRRVGFAPWIPVRYVSARRGVGTARLLADVDAIYQAGAFRVSTAEVNRALAAAVRAHPPPLVRGRQVKLRYAHKAGNHPPTVIVHGNQTEALPASYLRYLASHFRDAFGLAGTPVRVEARTGNNPFADRRNELTRRQRKRRKRVIRHRRGR